MTTLLTNNAEGGTEGTAVTAANSGGASGTAFSAVTIDTSGALTFAGAAAHTGSFGYSHQATTTGHAYYTTPASTSTQLRLRFYVKFASFTSHQFVQSVDSASGLSYLNANGTGGLNVVNAAGTTIYSGPNVMSLNTWYRVELIVTPGASATFKYALYAGDSTTAIDSYTSTTFNVGSGTSMNKFSIGKVSSGNACSFYIDDIVVDDVSNTTFIGPIASASGIAIAGTPAHTYGTLATGTVSKTATAPTGIALNDYLLMVVASHSSSTPSTVTTPTGWTLIGSVIGGQDTYVFGKVAVAGDVGAANYTVTFGGGTGTNNFEVSITRFTGVDPTTPVDVAAATVDTGYSGSTATQTMTLPAVTTATANAWQIAVVSMDDATSTMVTWAMAAGFTQADVGSNISFKTAYRAEATAGSTGTSTWTWTGSYTGGDMQGVTFALRPAAASTGPTAPTFVAHYGTGTATTSETAASYATSVTVAAGDLIVCCVATGNQNWYGNPPTGGSGLTWTTGPYINAASAAGVFTYWAIAQTSGTYTLTMTPGGSSTTARAMVVDYLRFSGAGGIGATASTASGGTAPSLNITTTQANSDIVMLISDYNAVTGARTYRTGAGTFTETAGGNSGDGTTDGRVGYYGAGVTTAATYTVGATAPTGEAPAMVALEILGSSGGGGGSALPAYRTSVQAGNAATGTASSLSITIPAAAQPGDVAVMTVNTSNTTSALTTPAGWTLRTTAGGDSTTGLSFLLTKTLVAGDIGTATTLTFAGSSKPVATIDVYANVSEANMVVGKTLVSTSTAAWSVPSMTGVPASSLIHYSFGARGSSTVQITSTTPATYTLGVSSASSSTSSPNAVDYSFYKTITTAGTYGGEAHTLSQSSVGTAYTIVFPPPSMSYTPSAAENIGIGDYPVVTGSMIKAAVAGSTITELTAAQNTGTVTVNTPAGTQPGDLLLCTIAEYAITTWSIYENVPAGWSRAGFVGDDTYGPLVDTMVMPVTATPAASYTFGLSSGIAVTATLTRITNADLGNPLAQPATLWEPGISFMGSSVTVPDETIMQPNVLVVTAAALGATGAADTLVPPASLATQIQNTGSGARHLIASKFQAAAGAYGQDTWTSSNTGLCWGFVRLYINSAGSSSTQMQNVGIVGTPTVGEGGIGSNTVTATTPSGARAGEVLLALLAHDSQKGPPYYPSGGWIRTATQATIDTQTIGVDSVSQGAGTAGTATATSVSWTHTTTATGQQRFLVVGVAVGSTTTTSDVTVTVTCNGTTLGAYGAVNTGASATTVTGNFSQTFIMINPPSGSLNIVVTTSAPVIINGGSVVFTGVDQSSPYGNAYYVNGTTGSTVAASIGAGNMPAGEMMVLVSAQSQAITGATSPGVLDVHRGSTTTVNGGNLAIAHVPTTGAAQTLTLNGSGTIVKGGLAMSLNPAPASTDVSAFYLPLLAAPDPSYTFYVDDGPATLILARVAGVPISAPVEWPTRKDWSTSGASQLTNLNDISAYEANTQHVVAIAQSTTGSAVTLSTVPPDMTILAQNSGVGKKLSLGVRNVAGANTVMPTTDLYQSTPATAVYWAFLYLVLRSGQVYQTNYTPTPADVENITDAVVSALGNVRSAAESIGITDAVAISITRTVSDTIGITDTGSGGAIYAPSPADAVGLTDAVSFAQTEHPTTGPDAVGITDTVSYSWGWGPQAADPVGITDSVSFVQTQSITVNDNIIAVDTATGGTLYLPTPNDAVPITDAITSVVQLMHPSVADSVGITDAVSWAITAVRSVADVIGATDAPALGRGVNPADSIGATDSILKSTGQYISIADNIGATDTTSHVAADVVSDSVPIHDTITTFYVIGRNPTENVGITDAIVISQNNQRTFTETIGVTDASAPFGNLSIVTATTADPDIAVDESGVALEDVVRLHGAPTLDFGISGNLAKGPQRASFSIGMTASLTHVTAISAEVDTEISLDPPPALLVVGRMTDIVVAQHVGVIMPMSLRNGPVYSDPVLGAASTGGPMNYLGPTDKPVWRLTRNQAVPAGWGSYIAADLFDDIPKGTTITLSVWVRANAGDAISFDILTDPAQFRPTTGFPDNSMVGTGAWRQYTKTFTLTDDWVANFQRFRSSVQTWIEWSDATVQLTAPRALKETPDPEPASPEPPKYNRIFTVLR